MKYLPIVLIAAFAVTSVLSHGSIENDLPKNEGSPGFAVSGKTPRPRDCASTGCGSPIDASKMVENNLRKRNFARALNQKRQEDQDTAAFIAALEATGSASKAEDGQEEKNLTKRQQDEAAAALEALKATGSAVSETDLE